MFDISRPPSWLVLRGYFERFDDACHRRTLEDLRCSTKSVIRLYLQHFSWNTKFSAIRFWEGVHRDRENCVTRQMRGLRQEQRRLQARGSFLDPYDILWLKFLGRAAEQLYIVLDAITDLKDSHYELLEYTCGYDGKDENKYQKIRELEIELWESRPEQSEAFALLEE